MSVYEKLKGFLKFIDLFSYPVPVDIHSTLCGGFFTMVLIVSLFLSTLYCFDKSLSHKYDTITYLEFNNNLE